MSENFDRIMEGLGDAISIAQGTADLSAPTLRTEADYEAALAAVRAFFENPPSPGSPDARRFELLIQMIKTWEDEHCPVPDASAVEVVNLIMEANGRTPSDLAEILGAPSYASEFLDGRRGLSVEEIRRLHVEWGVPADALIGNAVAS